MARGDVAELTSGFSSLRGGSGPPHGSAAFPHWGGGRWPGWPEFLAARVQSMGCIVGQRVFLPEARHGCGLFPDAAAHPWAAPRTLPLARHSERTQGTFVMAGRAAETLGVAFRRRSPPRTCLSWVERGRRDSPPSHGCGGAPPRDRGVHGPRARGSRAGAAARGAPRSCPATVRLWF